MGVYIVIGTLAAFGALCILGMMLGLLIPGGREVTAVAVCRNGEECLPERRRWRWLRRMGLVSGRLLLIDEALAKRLELEKTDFE